MVQDHGIFLFKSIISNEMLDENANNVSLKNVNQLSNNIFNHISNQPFSAKFSTKSRTQCPAELFLVMCITIVIVM